jgi:hypothetical protein
VLEVGVNGEIGTIKVLNPWLLSVYSTLAEEGLGSLLELQEASKNSTAIIESEAIKS